MKKNIVVDKHQKGTKGSLKYRHKTTYSLYPKKHLFVFVVEKTL